MKKCTDMTPGKAVPLHREKRMQCDGSMSWQRFKDPRPGSLLENRPCRLLTWWTTSAILLILSWLPAMALAAPMPVSVIFEVRMAASVGGTIDGSNLVAVSDRATFTLPTALSLVFAREALSTEGTSFARAYESTSAVITPFAGSVTFEAGYEFANPGGALSALADVTGGHEPWSYTFIPDVDGVLVFEYVDYDQSAGNLSFVSSGNASVSLLGSGAIERNLLAGEAFTIGLDLFAGPSCFGACRGADSGSATFSWAIVPEPSTLPAVASGLFAFALRARWSRRRDVGPGRRFEDPDRLEDGGVENDPKLLLL